jgi:hypothetical protein
VFMPYTLTADRAHCRPHTGGQGTEGRRVARAVIQSVS